MELKHGIHGGWSTVHIVDGQRDSGTFDRMTDEIENVIKENARVITERIKRNLCRS